MDQEIPDKLDNREKQERTSDFEKRIAVIEDKLAQISSSYDKMKSELLSIISERIFVAIRERGGADGGTYEVMEGLKRSDNVIRDDMARFERKLEERIVNETIIVDKMKEELLALETRLSIPIKIEDVIREIIIDKSKVLKEEISTNIIGAVENTVKDIPRRNDALEHDMRDIRDKLAGFAQKTAGYDKVVDAIQKVINENRERIIDLDTKLTMVTKWMEEEQVKNQKLLTTVENKLKEESTNTIGIVEKTIKDTQNKIVDAAQRAMDENRKDGGFGRQINRH